VGGFLTTMRILVLGSEGQIGSPFCKLAQSFGHDVIRFDKKLGKEFDLATNTGRLNVRSAIQFSDIVVFLAFEVGGSKYLINKDKSFGYISENVLLMENTFSQLQLFGKPFLFASSQMSNMHHTNYGFLKDLGERYTRALNGSICRFWNVYGYEDPNDPKSHVITDFIHMAKSTKKIHMMTAGQEQRQFLHADDCSRALLHWCENYNLYDKDQYIDITSFEWTSIRQIADLIAVELTSLVIPGTKEDKIQIGIKNEPSDYVKQFWAPNITLKEGIKQLL
jgi:nucleoside-diphosphate-sugar epimerase